MTKTDRQRADPFFILSFLNYSVIAKKRSRDRLRVYTLASDAPPLRVGRGIGRVRNRSKYAMASDGYI